jgi:hypothetical protein
MPWYEKPSLHILLFLLCVGVFLAFLWQEVIRWIVQWWTMPVYEERGPLESSRSRYLARAAGGLASLLGAGLLLYFLSLLFLDISWMHEATPDRQRAFLQTLLTFPLVFAALTPLLLAAVFMVWKGRYWQLTDRLFFAGIATAALITLWQFYFWNLLGYRF